jgi:hypothetical protein
MGSDDSADEALGAVEGGSDGLALARTLGNEEGASVGPDVADGAPLGSALGLTVSVGFADGRMEGRTEREGLEKDRRWARSRASATVRGWAGRSATRREGRSGRTWRTGLRWAARSA